MFIALSAALVAGLTMPFGIALVATMFQEMIDYAKSVKDGANKADDFLKFMHRFGISYCCVGLVLFVGGYLGTAFMNIAAINQVAYRM